MFQDKDEIYTFLQTTCLPIIMATTTILFFFKTTNANKQTTISIPGNPRGKYPLLGDTLQLLNPQTMATYQVSSRHVHGPIWRTSVLFHKCIFVSGVKNLQQLSKQEQHHRNTVACFPPHHRGLFGHHSVLVTSGREHLRLRSLITPTLQASKYKKEIDSAVTAFVARCHSHNGEYFPLVEEFKQFSLSVALRIVLGERRWNKWMECNDSESKLKSLLDDFAIWSKGLLSPPTSFIPFTASYCAMKARRRIHDILLDIIQEEKEVMHSQDGSSDNRCKCLIERLLRATTTNNESGVNSSLSEEAIIDNIFTIVFAGTDTTASVLTSAFYELAKNDELRERLETCVVKGDLAVGTNDHDVVDETLCAFLSEVQRCYPAAPFTMRNIAEKEIDLGDKYGCVPAGFNITYSIAGTLLDDEDEYNHPSKFDMDRWLATKDTKPLKNWAFGGGFRICPGRFLSVAESIALLRVVLDKKVGFQWKLKSDQDLTFSYTPGFFPKDGLVVKIKSHDT